MSQYRVIQKQLLIDHSAIIVASTIANSFGAFTAEIKYSLSSLDKELFKIRINSSLKMGVFSPFVANH